MWTYRRGTLVIKSGIHSDERVEKSIYWCLSTNDVLAVGSYVSLAVQAVWSDPVNNRPCFVLFLSVQRSSTLVIINHHARLWPAAVQASCHPCFPATTLIHTCHIHRVYSHIATSRYSPEASLA